MKIIKTLLLVLLCCCYNYCNAQEKVKTATPKSKTIYAFGISQDLAGSTVYITNIAPIAGAQILPHNILDNHQYYSEQLKKFLEDNLNLKHQTATFYFAYDTKKIEKKYAKVQAKMNKCAVSPLTFKTISDKDFRFKVPVLVTSED